MDPKRKILNVYFLEVSYNYDCPGTNQMSLNLFTKKKYETCPGPLAQEFVLGYRFAVLGGVVPTGSFIFLGLPMMSRTRTKQNAKTIPVEGNCRQFL